MGEGIAGAGIGCVAAGSISEGHDVERWVSCPCNPRYEVSDFGLGKRGPMSARRLCRWRSDGGF